MSNVGQAVSSVVGATIGFMLGGPAGAVTGFQLGLLGGSVLFPTKLPGIEGPRLEDQAGLDANPGTPVPILYGTMATQGFWLWAGERREVATTSRQGGKGGGGQKVTTYSYFQSVALGLCEGPIVGVRRIWENGELVYDVSERYEASDETALLPRAEETVEEYLARLSAAQEYEDGFTLHLGDEEQLPDPTMEGELGAGNVPAFRGLAYIVWTDWQLQEKHALRHPTRKIEVITAGGLSCETVTEYSGAYMPNWTSISVEDPRDANGTYEYRAFKYSSVSFPDVLYDSLEDARAQIETASGNPVLATQWGWGTQKGYNFSDGVYPWRPPTDANYNGYEPVDLIFQRQLFFHFNERAATGIYDEPYLTNPSPITFSAFLAPGVGQYYTGRRQNAGAEELGTHGVVYYSGPTFGNKVQGSYAVEVTRIPGPPPDISYGLSAAPVEGYFLNTDGTYVRQTPWTLVSGTFRVLSAARESGVTEIMYTRVPLNPCLLPSDPNYSNESWWTPYKDAAITAGTLPASPGTFGVTDAWGYVVSEAYTRELTTCTVSASRVSLATIVADICERCGLTDYDVSDLEERYVDGYAIERIMPGRAAIEPLRSLGFFDVVESGTVLKFPTRGKPTVARLSGDDIGAYDGGRGGAGASMQTRKLQDVELPRQVRLHYLDTARDYQASEQLSPSRLTTDAVNDSDIEIAAAIGAEQAAQAAEIVWADAWRARWAHEFTLDAKFLYLEPADAIEVEVDSRYERMRIVTIDDASALLRKISAVRDDDGSYVSYASADAPQIPPGAVTSRRATDYVFLDLPALAEDEGDAGFYVAAWPTGGGTQWPGAVVFRSTDGGDTFSDVATVTTAAVVGTLDEALADGTYAIFDEAATLDVTLENGELESRTEAAVLAGANAAAIGAPGRWQIIQFRDAELIGANQYRLSGILRGRRGTEYLAATSRAGDRFVLVSAPYVSRVPLPSSSIGASRVYKVATIGATLDAVSGSSFTGQAMALECFSPVQIEVTDEAGEIRITWVRRDRLAQTLRANVELALSEAVESYDVLIYSRADTAIPVRTLNVTAPNVTYTAAQIAADFGSPTARAGDIALAIFQRSALAGRGIPGVWPEGITIAGVTDIVAPSDSIGTALVYGSGGIPVDDAGEVRSSSLDYLWYVKGAYPGEPLTGLEYRIRNPSAGYIVDVETSATSSDPQRLFTVRRYVDGVDANVGGFGIYGVISFIAAASDRRYFYVSAAAGGTYPGSGNNVISKYDAQSMIVGGSLSDGRLATVSTTAGRIVEIDGVIYAAKPGASEVYSYDADTLELLGSISTPYAATHLCAYGSELWGVEKARPTGRAFRIDTNTGAELSGFNIAPWAVDARIVGPWLYVVSEDDETVYKYELNDGSSVMEYSILGEAFSDSWNYLTVDGRRISLARTPNISVLDTITDGAVLRG